VDELNVYSFVLKQSMIYNVKRFEVFNLKIKRGNKAKNKEKGQSAPYPK